MVPLMFSIEGALSILKTKLFTISLSVMAKLPATSYVRLVDIWLIFVQLYPFIQGNMQIFKNKI